MRSVSVLGAGAFGTALGIALTETFEEVVLWARSKSFAAEMEIARENRRRLPNVTLPGNLRVTSELPMTDIVLLVIPTQALGQFLAERPEMLSQSVLIACCKGMDLETGQVPSEMVGQHCPEARSATLTGPSFAVDVAAGLPTALTLACKDPELGKALQVRLSTPTLRLYLSTDPLGAELGALKNVVALAAGLTIGAGLGESARAAVVSRGFAEMQRIARALGGRPETLAGLSGLGDLILTCSSEKSRNYTAGKLIGQGKGIDQGVTIEGLATAKAVSKLAASLALDAPISNMVGAVIEGRVSVEQAKDLLLSRPLKEE